MLRITTKYALWMRSAANPTFKDFNKSIHITSTICKKKIDGKLGIDIAPKLDLGMVLKSLSPSSLCVPRWGLENIVFH